MRRGARTTGPLRFASISGSAKSTRIELRLSAADMNPYLAMAASLAAGLEGVERKLTPPAPTTNGYAAQDNAPLPRTLTEATEQFRSSEVARKWFGDEFVDHFAEHVIGKCANINAPSLIGNWPATLSLCNLA